MKQVNKKYTAIYFLMFLFLLAGCSPEEEVVVPVPEISGIESEYTVLQGDELEFSPVVTNGDDASYRWTVDGKEVANTLSYTFSSDLPGEYKLVLEASNKGGTGRKEAIVTVIDRGAPPVVSGIEEEYTIDADADLQLSPTVVSDNEVTYAWFMDEEEVANGAEYTFNALRPGSYEIILMVTNLGGTTEKKISIKVKAEVIRVETATHTLLSLETPAYLDDEAEIQWVATSASSELYRLSYADTSSPLFVAAKEGEYRLKVTGGEIEGEVVVTVGKLEQEASPYIAEVFDFLPAPGQFVNQLPRYTVGDTREDMVRKAGEYLIGEYASMITLGGWGGYVTFGFDHTIVNVPGRRDFRILGNAFAAAANPSPDAPFGGSCEPAVIMVAYDKNGNGMPDDDEWYEIKGSGNITAENEPWYQMAVDNGNDTRTFRDFEMTYYRPISETAEEAGEPNDPGSFATIKNYIRWTNNQGGEGYKVKNVYHSQSYYPAWVTEDQLTYKGIRLAENGIDESGQGNYFVLYAFRYGYVDNYPNNHNNSGIDIDWAIDKDGNKADLPGIDFVKVYNGVDQENGWLGEASTEVSRGEDLHLLGINIETINE